MNMSEQKHALQIHSLVNLDADCTCGAWSISCAAFHYQDLNEVRDRARREFQKHLHNVQKTSKSTVDERVSSAAV